MGGGVEFKPGATTRNLVGGGGGLAVPGSNIALGQAYAQMRSYLQEPSFKAMKYRDQSRGSIAEQQQRYMDYSMGNMSQYSNSETYPYGVSPVDNRTPMGSGSKWSYGYSPRSFFNDRNRPLHLRGGGV